MSAFSAEVAARQRLQRRWWLLALTWALALLLIALFLQRAWPFTGRWLSLAALVAAYELQILWRNLAANHRPGENHLLPHLGPGNRLTLLRGFALALLAGFLFSPWPAGVLAWAPAFIYTGAGIADYLDGYLARRSDHATILGERLDIAFDGLGVLVVILLAVWYGQLPLWYLPLGLGRYLFLAGIWWRQRRGLPVFSLPPSAHRRVFAGFHMGFLTVVLWPIIPPAGATIAGAVFGGATAASFLRDWGVVSGILNPAGAGYRRWQRRANRLLGRYLPPALRLLLPAAIARLLLALPTFWPPPWLETLQAWHLPLSLPLAYTLAVLAIAGTVATVAGLIPRLAAFALLFPLGFDIITRGTTACNIVVLVATLLLLLLGGGAFCVWQPEERIMRRRAGEE